MRKIKEVLRLKWACDQSERRIAKSCAISRSAIAETLRRARNAGLSWPIPDGMDDGKLEQLLFPPAIRMPSDQRPVPEMATVHQELKRKGVTLFLLWQEHKEQHPEGYQYSRFCDLYREWQGKLSVSMRQTHRAGEKLFVDYAGPTLPIVDPGTGEIREAQVFVAVLGASNYTYTEATWTQSLPDWIGSHVRAFRYFGGVPEIVVPDNLKSGITRPCRYDPDLNPSYADLARHYSVAIIPARVRKPKDKAKVEGGVLLVERWIMAVLRHRTFFSLDEANAAINALLTKLNERPFRKLPGCRREAFEQLDKPALSPLPATPYEYAEWKHARVGIDYHVEVDGHYYSVPYQLIKQQLDVRVTQSGIECFHRSKRVAVHALSYQKGRHTTVHGHMPAAHQAHAEWTPERLIRWSRSIGESTASMAQRIMDSRSHPQQGFRACLGLMRMGKEYGDERLESACRRALMTGATSYKSIKSILETGLDQRPLPEPQAASVSIAHDNIRGSNYFH